MPRPADSPRPPDLERLTAGPPPPEAVPLFGDRLDSVTRYAELLAQDGVTHGLIGPREVPRLWDRHLLNCALVAPLVGTGARVCDIGSGAGLPGLVLAIARPDVSVVLLEPLLRRTAFLERARDELRLGNVEVLRGRAEDQHGRLRVEVVTARAVAPLERLAPWALPLLEPDGELLALKGRSGEEELAAAVPLLRRLGATAWSAQPLGVGAVADPTTVVRVTVGADVSARRGRARKGRR